MKLPLSRRAVIAVVAAGSAIAGGAVLLPAGASAAVSYVLLGRSNYAASPTNINNRAGTPLGLVAKSGYAPLWVNSSKVVARLNADMVDGLHASAFARATGKTGVIEAFDDAAAKCPAGTVATGGGGGALDVDPTDATKVTFLPLNYSGPDIDLASKLVPNSWIVQPVATGDNTRVISFVICYNPKGAVPGAATAVRSAKLKAQLARR